MDLHITIDGQELSAAEIRAFLLGAIESASDVTTNFGGDMIEIYGCGRLVGREIQRIQDD